MKSIKIFLSQIEERINNSFDARQSLRSVIATEKKRELALHNQRRSQTEAIRKAANALEGSAADKKAFKEKLTAEMEETLKALEVTGERAKAAYNDEVAKLRRDIFSYQMQLGTDRAHRTYYLFESLPGVFVMTPNRKTIGPCLESAPIEQISELAKCSLIDRGNVIRNLIIGKLNSSDKENKVANHKDNKEAQLKLNGVDKGPEFMEVDEVVPDLPTEMLMCSGNRESCSVHGVGENWKWSFYSSVKELDALIAALNPRGHRERLLKEQLNMDRELIVNHIEETNLLQLHVTDERREECVAALHANPAYAKANLGFPMDATVPFVMEGTLVDLIVSLEVRMTDGHLGKLAVADVEAWRHALTFAKDDGQSDDLCWGPDGAYNKGKLL